MDKNPLLEAISIAGSQAKLARLAGVNQQDISYWLRKARKGIPLERVPAIEHATGGRVTRYDLRPDFFGADPSNSTIPKTKDIPPCLATPQSYATPQ